MDTAGATAAAAAGGGSYVADGNGRQEAVWSDVVATVPGGKKAAPRQVLTAARGYVRSGSGTAEGRGLVALMGPSGSGKSTLLTLLAGHEFAAEGTLKLNGRAYDETTSASVGFVPQQDRLLRLTVA